MKDSHPHVAFVVHTLNPGGTERLACDMAVFLRKQYRISIVCLDEPGTWAGSLREKGIYVACLWRQPGLDLRTGISLARFCRKQAVDLIHAHQCTPWFYAALSRLFFRKPRLLLEEHGRFYPEVDRPLRRFVNRALIARLTHRYVAVSKDIRHRLARYEGIDPRRVEVIYNGIHEIEQIGASDKAELRRSLGLADDDFVVGTVGRADPIKNLPMLVQAIEKANQSGATMKAVIVGDGPELSAIRDSICSMQSAVNFVITGYRDDARNVVQCLDLFVLCSFSEGISMALLEAMSSGIPAAVTNVGGNPEVVDDRESGWLIESDDAEALVKVLVEAARNPEKTARYGAAARRQIQAKFRFEQMVSQYAKIYRELLSQC